MLTVVVHTHVHSTSLIFVSQQNWCMTEGASSLNLSINFFIQLLVWLCAFLSQIIFTC